jgi:formylglycine-generating enzyme required for sulfatase activity
MGGKAPARDRALVGAALGRIGDPRFRADQWYLPADERLGFVEIPQGPFTMGSDKKTDKSASDYEQPISEVKLPAYFIGKWPVTVSQFKAFVDDAENGGFVPGNPKCVRGIGNHPVVYVSWHEAVAYCRWLTTRLRSSEATWEPLRGLLRGAQGRPWQVTLASEAEWEKAARGTDGRVYPWLGDEPDPNRANYAETGIGGPSAMGCFPTGQSVYEVEELSGNVWEWTRSIWAEYPYEPDYEGRSRESLAASGPRVVRGGAFNGVPRGVRAAYRGRGVPGARGGSLGFRVVVSPFSSDL